MKETPSNQKHFFQGMTLISISKNNEIWVLVSRSTKNTDSFIYGFWLCKTYQNIFGFCCRCDRLYFISSPKQQKRIRKINLNGYYYM